MNYEIVELEEKKVEGLQIKTTNENGKAMEDIGITWQRFFAEGIYEKIEHKANGKAIGLYTDYEKDYRGFYQFVAGVEVSQNSNQEKETVVKIIPKGKYAKFVIVGDVQKSVGELWSQIWQMDLNRTYTGDFEEYQNNSEDLQKQEIHVYIAIQ